MSPKEETRRLRKLVMDERGGNVLMFLGERNADPVSRVVAGDLEQALCSLPSLLREADERWKTSPRNPAYQPPAPPKPEAKPETKPKPATKAQTPPAPQDKKPAEAPAAAVAPAASPPSGDIHTGPLKFVPATVQPIVPPTSWRPPGNTLVPLSAAAADVHPVVKQALKEREQKGPPVVTPAPEITTQVEVIPEAHSVITSRKDEPAAPVEAPVIKPGTPLYAPVGEVIHALHTNDTEKLKELAATQTGQASGELTTDLHASGPAVATEERLAGVAPETPAPAAKPGDGSRAAVASATGEWEYYLAGGQGPFDSIQAAMDGMGLDKQVRPQHNRWDRLSNFFKAQILRRPKASK